jgi:hypothetical protein
MRSFLTALALAAVLVLQGTVGAETLREVGASATAIRLAAWALNSGDAQGLPYLIVDKAQAMVFVFDARGMLQGASPALLGLAVGDTSAPGIGKRTMSAITPEERTTPAGRFVGSLGNSLQGQEILWVDYEAGVALHRVIATVPKERRLQRLASRLPSDRRITFGCINVPVNFFDVVVTPAFRGTTGIVYILPETRSPEQVFGAMD